jgi:hypothetical protein
MKRILLCGFFGLLFWLINDTEAIAQASFEIKAKGAKDKHYVAIKGEEITPNQKYFYMFSQLTRYQILVQKDPKTKKEVLLRILDEKDKEIASNYNSKKKKYYNHINFKCGKTQKYTVMFEEK